MLLEHPPSSRSEHNKLSSDLLAGNAAAASTVSRFMVPWQNLGRRRFVLPQALLHCTPRKEILCLSDNLLQLLRDVKWLQLLVAAEASQLALKQVGSGMVWRSGTEQQEPSTLCCTNAAPAASDLGRIGCGCKETRFGREVSLFIRRCLMDGIRSSDSSQVRMEWQWRP